MLHVWNIYQHLHHKSPSFVGKYTIHGALGYVSLPEGKFPTISPRSHRLIPTKRPIPWHWYCYDLQLPPVEILTKVSPRCVTCVRWLTPPGKYTKNYGRSVCFMGKLTMSMAIFKSKLLVYQRVY